MTSKSLSSHKKLMWCSIVNASDSLAVQITQGSGFITQAITPTAYGTIRQLKEGMKKGSPIRSSGLLWITDPSKKSRLILVKDKDPYSAHPGRWRIPGDFMEVGSEPFDTAVNSLLDQVQVVNGSWEGMATDGAHCTFPGVLTIKYSGKKPPLTIQARNLVLNNVVEIIFPLTLSVPAVDAFKVESNNENLVAAAFTFSEVEKLRKAENLTLLTERCLDLFKHNSVT